MIHLIDIIFRFLDFFVIIALAMYGVKHYLIPAVEKMLREYGVFMYNLESDCKNLQLQTQAIYENIQDQDRNFQALQSKFMIWQKKCDELVIVQQQEQYQVDQNMQKRFEVRSKFIKNDELVKQQLPAILDGVVQDLQTKFRSVEMQKQYIDKLIDVMKEPL